MKSVYCSFTKAVIRAKTPFASWPANFFKSCAVLWKELWLMRISTTKPGMTC